MKLKDFKERSKIYAKFNLIIISALHFEKFAQSPGAYIPVV